MKKHNDPHIYARLLPVIQSSGMGKSRMIDELSKEYLLIPLNLRDVPEGNSSYVLLAHFWYNSGFPAADTAVYLWFTRKFNSQENGVRFTAFLTPLFETIHKVIDPPEMIRKRIMDSSLSQDEKVQR
jgi:hypothetical protein